MRRRGKLGKDKSVGYMWVQRWHEPRKRKCDYAIGWNLDFALLEEACGITREQLERAGSIKPQSFDLCRVTIEVIRDKRGRPIRRYIKEHSDER